MLRILLPLLALPTLLAAQDAHGHTPGMTHDTGAQRAFAEPGQGAFAALAEAVRVLEADPATDWSRVDLTGLRAHLVDMDLMVTQAEAEEKQVPGGLRMMVTGRGPVMETIRRMVPTHAVQLRADPSWKVEVEEVEGAVTLVVTSDAPDVVARIRGLGFFGLMASQDHHRAHHLAIVRGEPSHGH